MLVLTFVLENFHLRNLFIVVWYHALGLCSILGVHLRSLCEFIFFCDVVLIQVVRFCCLGLDWSCELLRWALGDIVADGLALTGDSRLRISVAPCAVRFFACSKQTLICWVCTVNHFRISNPLAWVHWLKGFWKQCWSWSGRTCPCRYKPRILASRSDFVGSSPFLWRHSFLNSHLW